MSSRSKSQYIFDEEVRAGHKQVTEFCHGQHFMDKQKCNKKKLNNQKTTLASDGCIEGFTQQSPPSVLQNSFEKKRSVTNEKLHQFKSNIEKPCTNYRSFLKNIATIPNFYDFIGAVKSQIGSVNSNGDYTIREQGFYIVNKSNKNVYYIQPIPYFMARKLELTQEQLSTFKRSPPTAGELMKVLPGRATQTDYGDMTAIQLLCPPLNVSDGKKSMITFDNVTENHQIENQKVIFATVLGTSNITLTIPLGPPLSLSTPCESIGKTFLVTANMNQTDINNFGTFQPYPSTNAPAIEKQRKCININSNCSNGTCWDKIADLNEATSSNVSCSNYLQDISLNDLPSEQSGSLLFAKTTNACYKSREGSKNTNLQKSMLYATPSSSDFPSNFKLAVYDVMSLISPSSQNINELGQKSIGFPSLEAASAWINTNMNKIKPHVKDPPYEILIANIENIPVSRGAAPPCDSNFKCTPSMNGKMCIEGGGYNPCVNGKMATDTAAVDAQKKLKFQQTGDTNYATSEHPIEHIFIPVVRKTNAINVTKNNPIQFTLNNSNSSNVNVPNVKDGVENKYFTDLYMQYLGQGPARILKKDNITYASNSCPQVFLTSSNSNTPPLSLPTLSVNNYQQYIKNTDNSRPNQDKYPIGTLFNVGFDSNTNKLQVNQFGQGQYTNGYTLQKLNSSIQARYLADRSSGSVYSTISNAPSVPPPSLKNKPWNSATQKEVATLVGNLSTVYNAVAYVTHSTGWTYVPIKLPQRPPDSNVMPTSIPQNITIYMVRPVINTQTTSCSSNVIPITSYEAGAFPSPVTGNAPNVSCLNGNAPGTVTNLLDNTMQQSWKNGINTSSFPSNVKESFTNSNNPIYNSVTKTDSVMNNIGKHIDVEMDEYNKVQNRMNTSVQFTNNAIADSVSWNIKNNKLKANLENIKAQKQDRYYHRVSNNYHFYAWGAAAVVLVAASLKLAK